MISTMAFQITGVSIVCSTVWSDAEQRKQAPRPWPLLANPPVTDVFPSQNASNAENVPIDDVIMSRYSISHIFPVGEVKQSKPGIQSEQYECKYSNNVHGMVESKYVSYLSKALGLV